MRIDAERLALALHAYHRKNGEQEPWDDLPEPARDTYREWARKVAVEYEAFHPDEGGGNGE